MGLLQLRHQREMREQEEKRLRLENFLLGDGGKSKKGKAKKGKSARQEEEDDAFGSDASLE